MATKQAIAAATVVVFMHACFDYLLGTMGD
jgi:hypothetical protein